MNLKLVYIFLILFATHEVKSQLDSVNNAKNLIFLEAAGNGGFLSANYERLFKVKGNLNFGIRIGLSTYCLNDYTANFNPDIIVPLGINGLYGKKHKLLIGVGQTITSIPRASTKDWKPEREISVHANFMIGYRYQKNTGGIMLSLSYTPMVEFYKHYRHWGAAAIGYAFKSKK